MVLLGSRSFVGKSQLLISTGGNSKEPPANGAKTLITMGKITNLKLVKNRTIGLLQGDFVNRMLNPPKTSCQKILKRRS